MISNGTSDTNGWYNDTWTPSALGTYTIKSAIYNDTDKNYIAVYNDTKPLTVDYPAPLVTVTVLFADDYPVENAWVRANELGTERWLTFGSTNETGQVEDCNSSGWWTEGWYRAYAWYPDTVTLFGSSTFYVDSYGRGNATITGNYEITSPVIEVLSPENMSYLYSSVPLNFTVYDFSSISWIGYSLDNEANVTISGNTTLTDLSLGSHGVIVYANDTYGNMGSSNKIYFTVANDVAITSVTPSKTIVGQGHSISINVTVENQGAFTATLNVTAHANTTTIQTKELTLTTGNSTTLIFTWNTTGVAKGNYTITAEATQLPYETDTLDNTLTDGWVFVTIPGDINGDKFVNIKDAVLLGVAFGSKIGDPTYNPNADINNDGYINIKDAVIQGTNFGKNWT